MARGSSRLDTSSGVSAQITTLEEFRAATAKRGRPEYAWQCEVMKLALLTGWKRAHFRAVPVKRGDSVVWQTPIDGDARDWPDVLLFRSPRKIATELKVKPNKPTPGQLAWLQVMEDCGFETFVWYPEDVDDVLRILAR